MIRAYTVALVVLMTSLPAAAYELKRDSSGEAVSWKQAVEFVVDQHLGEELDEVGAESAVRLAAATLSAAAGLPVSIRPGNTEEVGFDFGAGANNQNEIVALDEWTWDPRAIAVTVVTVNAATHTIVDADIALNAGARKFKVLPASSKPDPQTPYDDIQNTLTHELGHAVGLGHSADAPEAVMFPQATRGEVSKRTLAADDLAGLTSLYATLATTGLTLSGTGAATDERAAGCSAVPGSAGWMPLLAAALALLRRRRLAATLAAAISAPAFASAQRVAEVAAAAAAVRAEVISRTTLAPQPGARVLMTEVRVKTTECFKGSCPDVWVLLVPGGRHGRFEQTVDGLTVPEVGEKVAFTVAPGEETMRPSPSRVQVYRLRLASDLVAFLQGLARAKRVAGSEQPQR